MYDCYDYISEQTDVPYAASSLIQNLFSCFSCCWWWW